ncbi:MAG: DUF2336 domain-containing protein [Geminicoccaceae bacterium]
MSALASQDLSGAHAPSPVAGRRRARLVASGARTSAGEPLSQADVQALQTDPSPASRAALAAKFGRQYDQLIGGRARPLAEAVLQLLVRDGEPKVRQALAEAVAASSSLPGAVAARLAGDDLDVARPILELSPVLNDDDLAKIVRTHAVPHAQAVAGRAHLSGRLSDLLADTNQPEVLAALVGNRGAELSSATLRRIDADHQGDRRIQDRLIRRPDLPSALVDRFLKAIGERLAWQVLVKRRMSKAEARQLIAAVRDRATASLDPGEHGEPSVEPQLGHRFRSGELGPEDILGFLRDGETGRIEAGLALLAGVDPARARELLHGADRRGLAALCAQADFGAPHYLALRMALDLAEQGFEGAEAEVAYPPETITFVQKQYDLSRRDAAQIAFWFAT